MEEGHISLTLAISWPMRHLFCFHVQKPSSPESSLTNRVSFSMLPRSGAKSAHSHMCCSWGEQNQFTQSHGLWTSSPTCHKWQGARGGRAIVSHSYHHMAGEGSGVNPTALMPPGPVLPTGRALMCCLGKVQGLLSKMLLPLGRSVHSPTLVTSGTTPLPTIGSEG